LRDGRRVIGARGVDDDDLVGPGEGAERLADICRFADKTAPS